MFYLRMERDEWSSLKIIIFTINLVRIFLHGITNTSCCTVKPVLSGHSKIDKTKISIINGSLMMIENIAECSPWRILQFWSFFECLLKTGFTVFYCLLQVVNITRTGDIKFCKAFWSLPESPILAVSFLTPFC